MELADESKNSDEVSSFDSSILKRLGGTFIKSGCSCFSCFFSPSLYLLGRISAFVGVSGLNRLYGLTAWRSIVGTAFGSTSLLGTSMKA